MLMYADRSGYYSHGIARLSVGFFVSNLLCPKNGHNKLLNPQIFQWYANDVQKGLIDANAQNEPKVVQQMGAIAVVDGKNAHGK